MSFEMNKIAGAILAAMIVAMVSGLVADKLVQPRMLEKNVYEVAGSETAAVPQAAAPAAPEPIGPLLASASADAGKGKTVICATCHTFDKGGANKIGPNLYGVVGDEIAHGRGGFAFSDALKTKGAGQTWTPQLLSEWLTNPQAFAKGTKMTYAGMAKAKDRADVIAYLNSLSDSPKPFPAEAPAAAAPAAPAQPAAKPPAAPPPAAKPAGK
jgi:cytochrome c